VTFVGSFLGVPFLKLFNYKVAVVVFEVVDTDWQEVRRLVADRGLTLFGFKLKVTCITGREQVLTGDVTVASYCIISVCERFVTVLTCGSRSVSSEVVGDIGDNRGIWWGSISLIFFALGYDVVVKFRHDVRATVHSGWSLVLWVIGDPVTAKTANAVFIDDVGFRIRMGVFINRC